MPRKGVNYLDSDDYYDDDDDYGYGYDQDEDDEENILAAAPAGGRNNHSYGQSRPQAKTAAAATLSKGTGNRAGKEVQKDPPKSMNSVAAESDSLPTGGKKKEFRDRNKNGPSLGSLSDSTDPLEEMTSLKLSVSKKDHGKANGSNWKSMPLHTYKPEQWMLEGLTHESKHLLHLAVIGHVDAGKSTLMGRLLQLLGHVSQKEMHKYEKEAKDKGKGSFAYAWILDEGTEERSRGVTMTVAVAHFETPEFHVVLLDSPGHRDFVPNMISGASQADSAILVVDSSVGAFEAGMEGEGQSGGQTKEHVQLIRSFGVEQIIVAVNKMDAADYSKQRFTVIKDSLQPFLRQCGFKDSATKWIPLSAIDNQNLVASPTEAQLKSWYSGPNLLEAINKFEPPLRNIAKPFRVPIAEIVTSRSLGQAAVSGKLEGGAIKVGMKVLVMPGCLTASVKAIECNGKPSPSARAGDNADIGLQGIEPNTLIQGGVICHPDYPIPVASRLEVKILLLDIPMPILRGAQVVLHCHHVREPAKVVELISVLDQRTGAVLRRKPRCLTSHQSALIEIVTERAVCVEEYSDYKALGRITLRDAGKTLAVGIVIRVFVAE